VFSHSCRWPDHLYHTSHRGPMIADPTPPSRYGPGPTVFAPRVPLVMTCSFSLKTFLSRSTIASLEGRFHFFFPLGFSFQFLLRPIVVSFAPIDPSCCGGFPCVLLPHFLPLLTRRMAPPFPPPFPLFHASSASANCLSHGIRGPSRRICPDDC